MSTMVGWEPALLPSLPGPLGKSQWLLERGEDRFAFLLPDVKAVLRLLFCCCD